MFNSLVSTSDDMQGSPENPVEIVIFSLRAVWTPQKLENL